ncbi:MAG: hypothetical protein LBM77_14010 [Spirochaetaceae bacterium]|jgi:hypothetical protein|nr:hypothetical protein [Spirochaetaceae bacterium]
MKIQKFFLVAVMMLLCATASVFAQFTDNDEAMTMPSVYNKAGTLRIGGIMATGFGMRGSTGDPVVKDANGAAIPGYIVKDLKMEVLPFNTGWESNVGQLWFAYSNKPYTMGITMVAGTSVAGAVDDLGWQVNIPYFLAWASFWDQQIKVTIGKPYKRAIPLGGEKIYQTAGGYFSGISFIEPWQNNQYAARVDFNPAFLPDGHTLKIGYQHFLGKENAGLMDIKDNAMEFGIGAEYDNPYFNLVMGFRADGEGDSDNYMQFIRAGNGTPLGRFYGMNTDVAQQLRSGDFQNYAFMGGKSAANGLTSMNMGGYTALLLPGDAAGDEAYAYFGAQLKDKLVPGLSVSAQGWLVNLGDYNKYGFGHMDQAIAYDLGQIGVDGLSAKLSVGQDFFGPEVWADGVPNPVYLRIVPEINYSIGKFSFGSPFEIGMAKDVVDGVSLKIRPNVNYNLGGAAGQNTLTIEYTYENTKMEGATDPWTRHTLGFNVLMVF